MIKVVGSGSKIIDNSLEIDPLIHPFAFQRAPHRIRPNHGQILELPQSPNPHAHLDGYKPPCMLLGRQKDFIKQFKRVMKFIDDNIKSQLDDKTLWKTKLKGHKQIVHGMFDDPNPKYNYTSFVAIVYGRLPTALRKWDGRVKIEEVHKPSRPIKNSDMGLIGVNSKVKVQTILSAIGLGPSDIVGYNALHNKSRNRYVSLIAKNCGEPLPQEMEVGPASDRSIYIDLAYMANESALKRVDGISAFAPYLDQEHFSTTTIVLGKIYPGWNRLPMVEQVLITVAPFDAKIVSLADGVRPLAVYFLMYREEAHLLFEADRILNPELEAH